MWVQRRSVCLQTDERFGGRYALESDVRLKGRAWRKGTGALGKQRNKATVHTALDRAGREARRKCVHRSRYSGRSSLARLGSANTRRGGRNESTARHHRACRRGRDRVASSSAPPIGRASRFGRLRWTPLVGLE